MWFNCILVTGVFFYSGVTCCLNYKVYLLLLFQVIHTHPYTWINKGSILAVSFPICVSLGTHWLPAIKETAHWRTGGDWHLTTAALWPTLRGALLDICAIYSSCSLHWGKNWEKEARNRSNCQLGFRKVRRGLGTSQLRNIQNKRFHTVHIVI